MVGPSESTPAQLDPELTALPKPRRPWRRLTLFTLVATALFSLWVAYGLRSDLIYALTSGPPAELASVKATPPMELSNRWVHLRSNLQDQGVRYRRPLSADGFRLVPVDGHARMWVEMRVPHELREEHFIAPSSFVGRLLPLAQAGIRHQGLADAIEQVFAGAPSDETWILIDGETPQSLRWAIGVVCLLIGFALFNIWGLARLVRPVSVSK